MDIQSAETIGALLLGTAGGGAAGTFLSAWTTRKKLPAEVDNLIASGAEITVQSALSIAAAEAARADRAEARSAELEKRLDAALAHVDALQNSLNVVREELYAIRHAHDNQNGVCK